MAISVDDHSSNEVPSLPLPDYVVGIGASAGGLEALEKFLDNIEPNDRCAFVIVTHLSPDYESLLDAILIRHTAMPVKPVVDGVVLAPGTVYIIPPNKEMITSNGKLLLTERSRGAHHSMPIDIFFRSLAREYGPRAIAVILSGTGSDGSRSLAEINAMSGYVIVQKPDTAKFDGMPHAAIDTGYVDHIVDAEQIGGVIINRISISIDDPVASLEREEKKSNGRKDSLDKILDIINRETDIDFTGYKVNTIYRRIRRRMTVCEKTDIDEYVEYINSNAVEAKILASEFFINVTEFFRDKEAFDLIASTVIPELVNNSTTSKPIRVWIPGCSTGQEAYSISILLYLEAIKQEKTIDPQIFATDMQVAAIDYAAKGIYSPDELKDVPEDVIDACFDQVDEDHFKIISKIRRWIVFAPHNFINMPPFTRMDLISCRNALIYLDADAQRNALSLFNFGLRDGAYLFLGPSESVSDLDGDFEVVDNRWRLYTKLGASSATRFTARTAQKNADARRRGSITRPTVVTPVPEPRLSPAYMALLDTLVSSGVMISAQRDVIHVFGDARVHLHAPAGIMTTDIFKMIEPALHTPIATGIDRAAREAVDVYYPSITIQGAGGSTSLSLRVRPLKSPKSAEARYFLIIFGEETAIDTSTIFLDGSTMSNERIEALEYDLDQTGEKLQAMIEELETSNEELQSTNEELMASNEELQSTNEELHSVNEELYTVNSEFQIKNDELVELSRDVENLLSATGIGVIFIDDKLAVRRYTSAVKDILNIMPQDVGRSIDHITNKFVKKDLFSIAEQVLARRQTSRVERLSTDGAWWEVKVIPLRAEKGKPDGAVITLYDITTVKKAEIALQIRTENLAIMHDLTGATLVQHEADGQFKSFQPAWTKLSGQEPSASLGFGWIDVLHADDKVRVREIWNTEKSPAPESIIRTSFRIDGDDASAARHIGMASKPEMDIDGKHAGWVSVLSDVKETIQSENIVRAEDYLLEAVTSASAEAIAYIDAQRRLRYINDLYEHQLGVEKSQILGRRVEDVINRDFYTRIHSHIDDVMNGARVRVQMKVPSLGGKEEVQSVILQPDLDDNGTVIGFVMSARDVTDIIDEYKAEIKNDTKIGRALLKSDFTILSVGKTTQEIFYASSEACTLSSYSATELRRLTLPKLLPEFDGARLTKAIKAAEGTKETMVVYQTFLLNKFGDSKDVSMRLLSGGDAADDEVIVVLSDQTDIRAAESALRRRAQEASRSDMFKEVFASAATRTINEPLRKIEQYGSILVDEISGKLSENERQDLKVITDSTKKMRNIIEGVSEFSNIDSQPPKIKQDVDLNILFERVLTDLSRTIKEVGATVTIGDLVSIPGDSDLLETLFRHIIMNAVIYRSSDRPLEITVSMGRLPDWSDHIDIIVADNGIGFPEGRVNEAFSPFTQFAQDRSGSGMGLMIGMRIAEIHGGHLSIRSTSENGTHMLISLSRAAPASR